MAEWSKAMLWKYTLLVLKCVYLSSVNADSQEYCQLDSFNPRCPNGEVIKVTSAKFGRMKIGQCVPVSFGHIGCHSDVLYILDDYCSGKQSCSFNVPNLVENKDLSPCPKGLNVYLDASYTCVPVLDPSNTHCTEKATLDTTSGYISSFTTRKKCGDRKTSWQIKSSPGQQVNISLVDFGYGTANKKLCFGQITEEGHKSNATICRQHGQKEQHVYTSNGRDVVIELYERGSGSSGSEVLLYYIVFGCADVDVPEGAWYKRKGDVATVGCDSTDLSWTVNCEGTEWKGTIGSCPVIDSSPVREAQSSSSWIGVDNDFSMLILVCIGVGFVILIAICVALIIIKLRRRDPPPSTRLLDADYRKSVLEPFPPMSAHDSGHYRSLVKSRDQPGYPDPHSSSGEGSYMYPPQATDGTIRQQQQPHFSTLQHTVQRPSASGVEGAPDYFVLDKQFC